MSSLSWRSPSAAGVAGTLLVHLALVILFILLKVTVRPMVAPPLEVELLAGDLGQAEQVVPRPASPLAGSIRERRGEVAPLRHPVRAEPSPPDLAAGVIPERFPPPTMPNPSALSPSTTPGGRLRPVQVSPGRAGQSAVNVKVEGALEMRRLVHLVEPQFPEGASSGGVVKVRLVVTADGIVRIATIVVKAHPLLEEAALFALRQWRFVPAPGSADAEGVVTVEFVLR